MFLDGTCLQMIVACHHWTSPLIQRVNRFSAGQLCLRHTEHCIPSARRNTGLSEGIARRVFGEASTISQEEVLRPISLSCTDMVAQRISECPVFFHLQGTAGRSKFNFDISLKKTNIMIRETTRRRHHC